MHWQVAFPLLGTSSSICFLYGLLGHVFSIVNSAAPNKTQLGFMISPNSGAPVYV